MLYNTVLELSAASKRDVATFFFLAFITRRQFTSGGGGGLAGSVCRCLFPVSVRHVPEPPGRKAPLELQRTLAEQHMSLSFTIRISSEKLFLTTTLNTGYA